MKFSESLSKKENYELFNKKFTKEEFEREYYQWKSWYMQEGFKNKLEKNINLLKHKTSSRKIICLETNKKYNSILEAAEELNIKFQGIYKCCNSILQSYKNMHFKYIN